MSETTSARLQSISTKKYVCVEYPGYVKNVDKMLETLGGEEKLSKTYFNSKRRVELHFRPDDPYCHSVCGDLVPSRAVVLKVKRRRKKKKPEDESENDWEYEQDVLGIVHQSYKFTSLMDYQYVTPSSLRNSFSSIMTSTLLDEKQPLHIVPPIFSRLDVQGNYNYMSQVVSKVGSKGKPVVKQSGTPDEVPIEHTDTNVRKRRPSAAMGAIFSSKDVPNEPGAKCRETVHDICKNYTWVNETIKELEVLFSQRPIWSRSALVSHLKNPVKKDRLNKILPFFAFYWLNGPWRALWNRYGYDPRQNPDGKRYQICDFRVRERKDGREIPINRFRNSSILTLPVQTQRNRMSSAARIDYDSKPDTPCSTTKREDLPYTFHADKLPRARQIMYQLCDIYDDDIKKIITENDGKEKKCRERDGWFPSDVIPRIRACMTKKVEARIERELEERDDKMVNQNKDSNSSTNESLNASNEDIFMADDNGEDDEDA